MAQILLQSGIAASYSVVDLPEVLPFAAAYLSAVFPSHNGLAFYTPDQMHLAEGEFDVIVNVSSFGEMPLSAARGYVEACHDMLAAGGILISHNSICRTPGAAMKYSEYGYERFGLLEMLPQPNAAGAFHDQHLVLALGKAGMSVAPATLDRLGALLTMGLHDDLMPAMTALAKGRDDVEPLWTSLADTPVGRYVRAARALADGDRIEADGFDAYLEAATAPIASAFAARLTRRSSPNHVPTYIWREVESKSQAVIRARFQKALSH